MSGAPAVPLPPQLVDAVRAAAATGTSARPAVLAVDGPAGSGKTTIAAGLAGLLGAPVVHVDELFPGWDGLADAVPRLLRQVLEPLAAGHPAVWQRYDWDAGRFAGWHEEPRSTVYVVEGVAAGARACGPYLALLVWVEASLALRYARGIARDGEAFRPHWERWAAQEDAHFATEDTRGRAHLRLVTDDDAPRLSG